MDCRVAIVEDDQKEAERLTRCLERYGDKHGLRFLICHLASALELDPHDPAADVIFMDIDLPGMNGMEAAHSLRHAQSDTPLVFVTNLAQYAVHGYAVDALDFIVKPVTYDDFSLRMTRVMRILRQRADATIAIRTQEGLRILSISQIVLVEVRHHNLFYTTAEDAEPIRTRGTLAQAEEDLSAGPFLKANASCLVNMAHVAGVVDDRLDLDNGSSAFFSRSRKREGMQELAGYLGSIS